MLYSVIIPVYNRPNEVNELLQSLTHQSFKDFEVLIIEDGSQQTCEHVVRRYEQNLSLRYFQKVNSGQGFSRNFGFEKAKGDYFVVFDSDCLIPAHYFETVRSFLQKNDADCWGGPDRAHSSFTPLQKAINYSMTSFLTTGGIRGRDEQLGTYHPRSFNMGISRKVFQSTGGYKITRKGEDIEFSIRILKKGFKVAYIRDAYVYHKRRTSLLQFYKQLRFFGRARVNIGRYHPGEVQFVHYLPTIFTLGLIASIIAMTTNIPFLKWSVLLYVIFIITLFSSALYTEKNIKIALLSVVTTFVQLTAYSVGFIFESFNSN